MATTEKEVATKERLGLRADRFDCLLLLPSPHLTFAVVPLNRCRSWNCQGPCPHAVFEVAFNFVLRRLSYAEHYRSFRPKIKGDRSAAIALPKVLRVTWDEGSGFDDGIILHVGQHRRDGIAVG